jgi:hypothetical protein
MYANTHNDGTRKSMGNAFDTNGPSQVADKWGRIKTERQMLLDATRVNKETNIGYSQQATKSERAPR